jgi:hypothetical protein
LYKILVSSTYEFLLNYSISIDLDDFDPEASMFTGYFDDSWVDLDHNNLSEILAIDVGVWTQKAGNFDIKLTLYDGDDEFYDMFTTTHTLSRGSNIVTIEVNGTDLYIDKVSGPLTIGSISLIQSNITLDTLTEPYITNPFNFYQFELPPMPDITLSNFGYSGNQINAMVQNIGNQDAYSIIITYFDQNFSVIHQEIISYLEESEQKALSLEIPENATEVYTFIDYDNAIEEENESNNFYYIEISDIVNIYLIQGWNLISIPVILDNTTVPSQFESIKGNYTSVFAYNTTAHRWDLFNPTLPDFLNTLYYLDETMGFWIQMEQNDTLTVQGVIPETTTFTMHSDWNLIGYPTLTIQEPSVVFEKVQENCSSLYMYNTTDPSPWKLYNPDVPSFLNNLHYMYPGYGYWLWGMENTTPYFNGTFY